MIIFQLSSLGFTIVILRNLVILNLATIFALFDIHFPFYIVYIHKFVTVFSMFFFLFLVIQSCIIRYWTEFIWKSVRPIDDRFVMAFLTAKDTFLSILFSTMVVWNADGMKDTWWLSNNHPLLMSHDVNVQQNLR